MKRSTLITSSFLLITIWSACTRHNNERTKQSIQSNILTEDTALANILHEKAKAVLGKGLTDSTIQIIHQELSLRNTRTDSLSVGKAYYTLGITYTKDFKNNPDSAFFYLNIAHKYNNKTAYIKQELAKQYYQKGNYEEAIHLEEEALTIADPEDKSSILLDLSDIYSYNSFDPKSLKKAIIKAEQGLTLSNDAKEKKGLLLNKGNALLSLKKYPEAIESLEASLKTDPASIELNVNALTNIGIAEKRINKYDLSLSYMRKGLTLASTLTEKATSYNNIADVLLLTNHKDSALFYYQKAIDAITARVERNSDWRTNPNLSDYKRIISSTDLFTYLHDKADALQLEKEHWKSAVETYSIADSLCDLIRKASNGKNTKDTRLFWRQQAYPMYVNAVRLCFQLGYIDLAYRFFEKSRSVLLLDGTVTQDFKKPTVTKTVDLHTLQSKIEPETALVEYLLEENTNKGYALMITRAQVKLIQIDCPESDLMNFVAKDQLAENPQAQTFYQWYNRLIQPLSLPSGIHNLVISPNGLLSRVSFEALLKMPSLEKKNYLINDYAISYCYSASLQYSEKFTKQAAASGLLGFSPVTFSQIDPSLPPLKLMTSEERPSGNWLFYEQAKVSSFERIASEYKYLIFWTHATDIDTVTHEPTIYLSDQRLSLSQLCNAHLNASLAMLTACETNAGVDLPGEGVNSLARGFAYAGVPSTIATLWNTPESATYKITTLFYHYLSKGLAKNEALRKAKLDFLDNHAPMSWAALVLIGDTTPSESNREPIKYFILLGGLIILSYFVYKQWHKYKQQ